MSPTKELSDEALTDDYIRCRRFLENSNDMSDISAWEIQNKKLKDLVIELKSRDLLTKAVNAYFAKQG